MFESGKTRIRLGTETMRGGFRNCRVLGDTDLMMHDVLLLEGAMESGSHIQCRVELNAEQIRQVTSLESSIRGGLGEGRYLKSELVTGWKEGPGGQGPEEQGPEGQGPEGASIILRFPKTRGQVQTDIRQAPNETPIGYGELITGQRIDLVATVTHLWCHRDYYPSFIYKWHAKQIYALEKMEAVAS